MSESINNEALNESVESADNSILGSEPAAENTSEEVVAEVAAPEKTDSEKHISFLESLSSDLRKEKSLQTYKDVESLAKSHVELQKKFGKRFEDLTADEIKSIDTKFGAPEKAEDYGIELSDDLKNDPILGNIHQDLFDAGIPKDKANKLMEKVLGKIEDDRKNMETELKLQEESKIEAIKKEFGSAFDARKDLANKALRQFGGEDAIKSLQQAGLSNDPAIFKMLAEVGKLISEDSPVVAKESTSFGITPDEAAAKIAELRADPEFNDRVRNINHQGHLEAVNQLERLYRLKAGKK